MGASTDVVEYLARGRSELYRALVDGVAARRADRLSTGNWRARIEDELFAPARTSATDIHACDSVLIKHLPAKWEFVECSPVFALGLVRALTGLSQFEILVASRDAELVSDAVIPLTVLAARRFKRPFTPVTLATTHREVRLQRHTNPDFLRHFRAFSVATLTKGGRHHVGSRAAVGDQLRFWIACIRAIVGFFGVRADIEVEVSHAAISRRLMAMAGISSDHAAAHTRLAKANPLVDRFGDALKMPLGSEDLQVLLNLVNDRNLLRPLRGWLREVLVDISDDFADVSIGWDFSRVAGATYYNGPCYHVSVVLSGKSHVVVDGGFSDWGSTLLEDRSVLTVTGGLGSEHLISLLARA